MSDVNAAVNFMKHWGLLFVKSRGPLDERNADDPEGRLSYFVRVAATHWIPLDLMTTAVAAAVRGFVEPGPFRLTCPVAILSTCVLNIVWFVMSMMVRPYVSPLKNATLVASNALLVAGSVCLVVSDPASSAIIATLSAGVAGLSLIILCIRRLSWMYWQLRSGKWRVPRWCRRRRTSEDERSSDRWASSAPSDADHDDADYHLPRSAASRMVTFVPRREDGQELAALLTTTAMISEEPPPLPHEESPRAASEAQKVREKPKAVEREWLILSDEADHAVASSGPRRHTDPGDIDAMLDMDATAPKLARRTEEGQRLFDELELLLHGSPDLMYWVFLLLFTSIPIHVGANPAFFLHDEEGEGCHR